LIEILGEYDKDAKINVTMYPSWRGIFVMILWRVPYVGRWSLKHNLDVLPSMPITAVSTSDSGVDIG